MEIAIDFSLSLNKLLLEGKIIAVWGGMVTAARYGRCRHSPSNNFRRRVARDLTLQETLGTHCRPHDHVVSTQVYRRDETI